MKHAEKANGFEAGGPQLYYAKTMVAFYSISLKAENVSAEIGLGTETEYKMLYSLIMFHANSLQLHNYNDNKHL